MQLDNRGTHPNSVANLIHEGRPKSWDEPKKRHNISVTETGWTGVQAVAKDLSLSVSELLEKIGRGELNVSP